MSDDQLKAFFGDEPPADALAAVMQEETAAVAALLRETAPDRQVLVVAIVFADDVVDRITSLGSFLNKQQAHDAEVAIGALLMHQSEEDGGAE